MQRVLQAGVVDPENVERRSLRTSLIRDVGYGQRYARVEALERVR